MADELIEMGRSRCPSGKILRVAYRRKDGVRVKAACVPDTGAPGKTPPSKRFAKFSPGFLGGWHKDESAGTRHRKLERMTRRVGCLETIRRLNELANVTTDKPTERKARSDRAWLHNQNFCHLKTKK